MAGLAVWCFIIAPARCFGKAARRWFYRKDLPCYERFFRQTRSWLQNGFPRISARCVVLVAEIFYSPEHFLWKDSINSGAKFVQYFIDRQQ